MKTGLRTRRIAARRRAGFTLTEVLIASGVALLIVSGFALFMQATGVTIVNVTGQSGINQEVGHAAEYMVQRVRLANSVSNFASGEGLRLTFDDDPAVDSDLDRIVWNDIDHVEEFQFQDGDGNDDTLKDNSITYNPNVGTSTAQPFIAQGVRKLTGLQIFSVTNRSTALINFGLLFTNSTAFSQTIEIRTQARARNRLE